MQIITISCEKKSGDLAAFFSSHLKSHSRKISVLGLNLSLSLSLSFGSTHVQAQSQANEHESIAVLQQQAKHLQLAKAPTWTALLHVNDNKTNINSPKFLLSSANFSLENELNLSIEALFGNDKENLCRFPARYLWLSRELKQTAQPLDHCKELQEFRNKAPADKISLSFASENLSQPSSMMGHVFLKLEGKNNRNEQVEHAISFFTDTATINLPKLFFDSLVIGKKGYFSLAPYQEKIRLYSSEEQRSVWEYDLNLQAWQRELIHNHLIELKQSDLTYFFQKYNCATVIDFILSVAAASPASDSLWLTPKDVVKRANEQHLISESKLISPNRWIIRALSEQLSSQELEQIHSYVIEQKDIRELNFTEDKNGFAKLELSKAYYRYLVETDELKVSEKNSNPEYLETITAQHFSHLKMSPSQQKNPLFAPQDSQVLFGLSKQGKDSFARFTFTPVSHHLEDDNSQYFSENGLAIFEFSLLKNLRNRQISLDQFTLYAASSIFPHDKLTKGISGQIKIGVEPQLDQQFHFRKTPFIDGALGYTKRLAKDFDVYGLMGLGLGYRNQHTQLYLSPELGVIIREVFNMKSIISLKKTQPLLDEKNSNLKLQWMQSKYFDHQNYSLHFQFTQFNQNQARQRQVELSIKKIF